MLFIVLRGEAFAAAAPAYNGKMNAAVGGVISQKMGRWGFAANDPRFGATMAGVGAGVTTVAVGVSAGAVAAVGWPALLVGAGISALVTGAISLAQDGVLKWLFNPDGTITTNAPGTAGTPYPDPPNGSAWQAGDTGVFWLGQDCLLVKPGGTSFSHVYGQIPFSYWCGNSNISPALPYQDYTMGPDALNGGSSLPTAVTAPVSDTVAALPASETAKPLSDTALAAAANAAWKAMPATTPNALPWSATDPITPADVAQWKAANPDAVPTVGDALAPVTPPGSSTVPITQPGTSPAPGPAPSPGQGAQVDLGPNPNVAAPSLEATPTAQQILSPVLNLMPDLRNFAVPTHSSECPKGSFEALGKTYTIDSQCPLIESNRAILEAVMLLVWSVASVFIVLRA